MNTESRIFVAGHRGLVGSALRRRLQSGGFDKLIIRTHAELDLEDPQAVEALFAAERPEFVFLAAAKVGGIHANSIYPVNFLLSNLKIQNNIIEASWRHRAKGLLFLGSSCIYPRLARQPLREEYLLSGALEPTNEPYAIAKIAGIELCESFNRQYGTRFLSVMPTNLYGPNDSYHLQNSHVLPAMIRKFHLAKNASQGNWEGILLDEAVFGPIPDDFAANLAAISKFHGHSIPEPFESKFRNIEAGSSITLWGTGAPRREFLYSDDLADACVLLMERLDLVFEEPYQRGFTASEHLVNIGCGEDVTISDLASQVAGIVGFDGSINWDSSKPDGTPRKLLDVGRINRIGWKATIGLARGIRLAYADYLSRLGSIPQTRQQ